MEKKYFLLDTGTVTLRKSYRAKRISIHISPGGKVSVVIPYILPYREGIIFLEKKKRWVHKTLLKLDLNKPPEIKLRQGENTFTQVHRLFLEPILTEKIRSRITSKKVLITYPSAWSVNDHRLISAIDLIYIETLRREAKAKLPERVRQLAEYFGYSYRRVFLKNIKTRWGSCSTAGNINLNIHLIQLPIHLIDYVILHELVHTAHKNHGPGFWAELDRITGKAKALDKELKKYNITSGFFFLI